METVWTAIVMVFCLLLEGFFSGSEIAVVTNTTMATALMILLFGEGGSWLAIVLMAPLIWIFGEIVPKSGFQQKADAITSRAIFLLRFASYVFFPLLIVFTGISGFFTRILGRQNQNFFILRGEIVTMLQMPAEEGDIQPVEKTMIRRIFGFSEKTAYEVMVPLIDLVAIEQGSSCADAVRLARDKAHACPYKPNGWTGSRAF